MIFGQNQEISVIVLALASNNVGLLGLDCTSSRRAAAKAKSKNEGGLQLASHLQRRTGRRHTHTAHQSAYGCDKGCHGVINFFLSSFFCFYCCISLQYKTQKNKNKKTTLQQAQSTIMYSGRRQMRYNFEQNGIKKSKSVTTIIVLCPCYSGTKKLKVKQGSYMRYNCSRLTGVHMIVIKFFYPEVIFHFCLPVHQAYWLLPGV